MTKNFLRVYKERAQGALLSVYYNKAFSISFGNKENKSEAAEGCCTAEGGTPKAPRYAKARGRFLASLGMRFAQFCFLFLPCQESRGLI